MKLKYFLPCILFLSCNETEIGDNSKNSSKKPEKEFNNTGLKGNNIRQILSSKKFSNSFIDPIDDSINYENVKEDLYIDKNNKIYKKTYCISREYLEGGDTTLFLEYLKDFTDFINLKTYKVRTDGYIENRNKLYRWEGNSDGEYAIPVIGADLKTFKAFENIAGGKDYQNVYYYTKGEYQIIKDADPNTIKVLKQKNECWNCGNCYFVDKNSIYFGTTKLKNIDFKTFRLINGIKFDSEDKNGKILQGKRIN